MHEGKLYNVAAALNKGEIIGIVPKTHIPNYNAVSYTHLDGYKRQVLMHMLAQVCDMRVGELVHVIADAHIYDRHIPIIKELIQRPTYDAPTFWLNPDVKDFYEFTRNDVRLDNYVTGPQIQDIPIAI